MHLLTNYQFRRSVHCKKRSVINTTFKGLLQFQWGRATGRKV